VDYYFEQEKKEMRKAVDMLLDQLEFSKGTIISAREWVAHAKTSKLFLLNYSPDKIMQINLWVRNSYKTEAEIVEMEAVLKSYDDNFRFHDAVLSRWLNTLIERGAEIIRLMERK
jgi:hypothetical protein